MSNVKKDMLGSVIRALVGVPQERLGVILDIVNKIGGENGVVWKKHLAKALREGVSLPIETVELLSEYLRQLYVDEMILLDPTDGTRTIAQATDVFEGGIDADFVNWSLDKSSCSTIATSVRVYEHIKDGTFKAIYGTNYPVLDKMVFTQHQIIDFCVKHKDKLRQDGYGTFFLFKKDDDFPANENNLFVAYVGVYSGGRLGANVHRFSDDYGWDAESQPRFVIPQLFL
jgi:hypothetical protein